MLEDAINVLPPLGRVKKMKMRRQINRLSGLKKATAGKILPEVIFSQKNKAAPILQYQEGAKNDIIFW
jgi:hypothetical protein